MKTRYQTKSATSAATYEPIRNATLGVVLIVTRVAIWNVTRAGTRVVTQNATWEATRSALNRDLGNE